MSLARISPGQRVAKGSTTYRVYEYFAEAATVEEAKAKINDAASLARRIVFEWSEPQRIEDDLMRRPVTGWAIMGSAISQRGLRIVRLIPPANPLRTDVAI